MNISQVLERKDFRVDLFHTSVCGKVSVTDSMVERGREYLIMERLAVYLSPTRMFSCSRQ